MLITISSCYYGHFIYVLHAAKFSELHSCIWMFYSKKLLRKVQCRLKLLKNKRSSILRNSRDDVAQLLRFGYDQNAFDRVHICNNLLFQFVYESLFIYDCFLSCLSVNFCMCYYRLSRSLRMKEYWQCMICWKLSVNLSLLIFPISENTGTECLMPLIFFLELLSFCY